MGALKKSRVVLAHARLERWEGAPVTFAVDLAEPGCEAPATAVRIPYQQWEDFGRPDEVTVTIEPGSVISDEVR